MMPCRSSTWSSFKQQKIGMDDPDADGQILLSTKIQHYINRTDVSEALTETGTARLQDR